MITGRVVEFSNSYVVVFTKDEGAQLGVRDGDEVQIGRHEGAFERNAAAVPLKSPRPDVAEQLRIARQVIAENREALIELAK
jgi:hypothetical protein